MIQRPTGPGEAPSGGRISWEVWAPAAPASRILAVLGVLPGERPLCPEFGWAAHAMGALDSEPKRAVAAVLAEDALRRWAPDLAVDRVDVLDSRPSGFAVDASCGGRRYRVFVPRVAAGEPARPREDGGREVVEDEG